MAWTAPRTWVASEVVDAATMNAHVRDNLKAIGDPWVAYTPTWTAVTTNPALGNGTLTGAYMKAGSLLRCRLLLTMGSTTTYGTGPWRFSLPAAAVSFYGGWSPMGQAILQDVSASARARWSAMGVGSPYDTFTLIDNAGAQIAAGTPYAWASGDVVAMTLDYEAA